LTSRDELFRRQLAAVGALEAVDQLCGAVGGLGLGDILRLGDGAMKPSEVDEELQLLGVESSVVRSRIRAALRSSAAAQ
jgi:hypothetical protein